MIIGNSDIKVTVPKVYIGNIKQTKKITVSDIDINLNSVLIFFNYFLLLIYCRRGKVVRIIN